MSRALDIATAAPASAAGLGRSKAASDLFAHPVVPVLTGVAVALLVAVAVNFARSSGLVVGLWAASGVAVAVWLRTGSGRRHDMVFALVLTVSLMIGELISGNSPALSLLFTAGNMIEIGAAVFLVRRVLPSLHILSLGSTVRFLLCALIAPVPAGLAVAFALPHLGQEASLESFKTWWFGHALGIAVIGVLGVHFDWQAQAQTVVDGVRLTPDEKARTRVLLLDQKHRVLAASDGVGVLSETVKLDVAGGVMGSYAKGDRTVGYARTPGYETYQGLGWYGCLVQDAAAI
ncbi:MASE1 domain-containing protein [Brevundimonas sp.]|uniref:MASE1 domain-containing protein n=1 Tax=Brevundimonas sp. TaxID=1871086 RepID=UPI0025C57609|nr:MASE1 domain-containing protein [Brevundimonas sp.]